MRKLFAILTLLPVLSAEAQNEGGLWLGTEVDYDVTSRFGAEFALGARLEDDWSRFTRYDAGLGLDLKATRWLKLGVGYEFARDNSYVEHTEIVYKKDPSSPDGIKYNSSGYPVVNGFNVDMPYWRTKHRINFDLIEKWKLGRLAFSLRERYLFAYNAEVNDCEYKYRDELEADDLADYTQPYYGPYVDEDNDSYWYGLDRITGKSAKKRHYLRTRLGVEYNIRRCPVTPFAACEISNDLGESFAFDRHRVTAGFDWNLTRNKQHMLSLAYLYQHGAQEESGDNDLHIVSVSYKFSFQSARAARQKKAAKKARQQRKAAK